MCLAPGPQAALGGLAKATDECRKATTEWVVGGSGLEDEDTRFFGRAQTGHIQPFTGAIAPHYNGSRAYQCGAWPGRRVRGRVRA